MGQPAQESIPGYPQGTQALTALGHTSASSVGEPLLTNNCVDPCHAEVFRAKCLLSVVLWDVLPESSSERVGRVPGGDGFCLILTGLGSYGWLSFSQTQKGDIKLLKSDTKEVLTRGKKAFCSFCNFFFFLA